MVTANNYMFRPLTGHHQVVHLVKDRSYIVYSTAPPLSLDVQPDDGLLEAETCIC